MFPWEASRRASCCVELGWSTTPKISRLPAFLFNSGLRVEFFGQGIDPKHLQSRAGNEAASNGGRAAARTGSLAQDPD
jgi:hypothetical protein